jgi:uncharacterized membrane protein YczE
MASSGKQTATSKTTNTSKITATSKSTAMSKSTATSPLPLRVRTARRLTQLYVGLAGYGASMALMVSAHLGNQPWDVFHQGLGGLLGMSFGTVSVFVGGVVLLLWIPLRQRPGLGTVSNVFVIGLTANLTMVVLPIPTVLAARIGYLVAGILLCGLATGLYIGARLGPGPRDGLMTGLAARGVSIRLARTGVEVTVVAIGWLLGGTLGVGTIVYALAIGPLVQLVLPRLTVSAPPSGEPWPDEPTPPDQPTPSDMPPSDQVPPSDQPTLADELTAADELAPLADDLSPAVVGSAGRLRAHG